MPEMDARGMVHGSHDQLWPGRCELCVRTVLLLDRDHDGHAIAELSPAAEGGYGATSFSTVVC